MKWRKRKQPLRAIPRNGIPIGIPSWIYSKTFSGWTWYPVDIINLFLFGLFYLICVDGGGEVEWKNVEKNLDFF